MPRVVLMRTRSSLVLGLIVVLVPRHLRLNLLMMMMSSLLMPDIRTWKMHDTPRSTLSALIFNRPFDAFNALNLFRHPISVSRRRSPHIS